MNRDEYASAGCQVVIGYPKCAELGNQPDAGPWKTFKANAYHLSHGSFPYILLEGRDAKQMVLNGPEKISGRLRFGPQGGLVSEVKTTLEREQLYEGCIDGDFGERTVRAVLKYQTARFGPSADDGIVGPITASALGITWPKG